jgi:phosphatidylethanolamine/phosphatidyl-N-methylethanolamine N-methyltransferase
MSMQEATTRVIYDVQSVFYDVTFGKLVRRHIRKAITHMDVQETDVVLDVGIGTGASLHFYPTQGRIVGIDLSGGMLRECRKKIREQQRDNVMVLQGNALGLPFADNTFDHVFISHVISVVSDPFLLIREAQRVAKKNARIIIVNHFQSTNPVIAKVEKWLCPLCTKLGWRSDLALCELIQRTGMQIDYRYKLESLDLWETVVVCNNKSMMADKGVLAA